ncbi:hypothetical protein SEA_AFFECA_85 [Gordonia phage Affeca]|nr:hypothetical protein SEA_AFFECA_85 [Gordonia phage Affeca]
MKMKNCRPGTFVEAKADGTRGVIMRVDGAIVEVEPDYLDGISYRYQPRDLRRIK